MERKPYRKLVLYYKLGSGGKRQTCAVCQTGERRFATVEWVTTKRMPDSCCLINNFDVEVSEILYAVNSLAGPSLER